jgi:hypothetical protein
MMESEDLMALARFAKRAPCFNRDEEARRDELIIKAEDAAYPMVKVLHLNSVIDWRTGEPSYPPGSKFKIGEADIVFLDGKKIKDRINKEWY